jgi:EPS-associated MarR family transcriptional regulator
LASRRKEYQEDAKLRMMEVIKNYSQLSTREIAQKIRISNGSAHYLLASLIDKGFVLISHVPDNSKKGKYSYTLTPKGIREKSIITSAFLVRKKHEFEALKEEIYMFEKSIGNDIDHK